MPDREPVHGISFETGQTAHTPDSFGLFDIEIPDPAESMLNTLAEQHNLDRSDPEVTTVLGRIRELKREHPDNPNVKLCAYRHIQNLLVSRRQPH